MDQPTNCSICDISKYIKNNDTTSMLLKFSEDSDHFKVFRQFESTVIKDALVAFTGGPVWTMSWAPSPTSDSATTETEQYLAVASLKNTRQVVEMHRSFECPSIVQLWKFNKLDNADDNRSNEKPIFVLGIAHNYGVVKSMDWCPFDDSCNDENWSTKNRLGFLALATTSGVIPIYDVPKSKINPGSSKIFEFSAIFLLKPKDENVQCTKVTWLNDSSRYLVCAGYSNGTVNLFDLTTNSTESKNGNIIYPFRWFMADDDGLAIMEITSHLSNSNYITTSSNKRTIKYWDIDNLSGPICETNIPASPTRDSLLGNWTVNSFTNIENIRSSGARCGNRKNRKIVQRWKDIRWGISYSNWNGARASLTNDGRVILTSTNSHSAVNGVQPNGSLNTTIKVISESKLLPIDDFCKSEMTDVTNDNSSVINTRFLYFIDNSNEYNKERDDYSDITSTMPDKFPISSANIVSWNPNQKCSNWLAIGYECGLVRVLNLKKYIYDTT